MFNGNITQFQNLAEGIGCSVDRSIEEMYLMKENTDHKEDLNFVNRRQFFRINLPIPLGAGMTISEFKGKKVQLGSTNVLIKDIGPGGIKIESIVKLPVRSDLVLKFNTRILGQNLELYGSIVWKGETNDHTQLYGISFIVDENERANLTSLLNQLQVKLRDKSIAPDSFFITDRRKFLKPTDSNKSKY